MNSEKIAEVFVFEDSFFFTTRVRIKRVEGDKIVLRRRGSMRWKISRRGGFP